MYWDKMNKNYAVVRCWSYLRPIRYCSEKFQGKVKFSYYFSY